MTRDDISGKERDILLSLVSYHFSDKHRKDGFRLDLTVTDYDAGFYEVGRVRIEARKEDIRESLASHETEILSQAGLDSEAYGIEQFQQNGEVCEKDEVLCRNLAAVGCKLVADCTAVYGGKISRSILLGDTEGDNGSGRIGYLRIDKKYVIKNSVRPLLSGIAVFVVGICSVVLVVAMALTMIRRARPYGMAVAMFTFFTGVMFSLRFLVRTGSDYADGRRGYRTVQDEAYGREMKEVRERYATGAVDVNREGYLDEVRYTDGEENPEGDSACGKPDLNETALVSINLEYQSQLSVPGTEIDYSVVWREDNEYYLNHNFYQEQHISGCVFTNPPAAPLAVDNTVLYGHNMKDGSISADLKKYNGEALFRENLVTQVLCRGKWLECPISSHQLHHQSDAGICDTNFMEGEWLPYPERMETASLCEAGIIPERDEKLVTFSTCYSKDQHLIVQTLLHGM